MSDAAHTVPGQSILERLYARGVVRPSIGATASFYARFGLADPWTEFPGWDVDESDSDGLFYFLSAAPYYARLRAQRQREWRARRRLLMRLSDTTAHLVAVRAVQRLAGPSDLGAAWIEGAPSQMARIAAIGSTTEMVTLSAAPEQGEEAARPERGRWRGREGWTAPRRRREAAEAAPGILEQVLSVSSGATRRLVVRVIEDMASLPPEERVVVARRVTRDLRGPAARMVRAALADAEVRVADTPVRAAAERAEPAPRRRRGLRPMLASSPAMQALVFEEPVAEVAPAAPVRRRAAPVVAPQVRPPGAHREVPEAPVAREVRTQRVTGRAGPEPVEAAIAAAPAPVRRRPTERVAILSRETRPVAPDEPDVRYGLETVRAPTRRGIHRLALRAVSVSAVDSRGEHLLSPSPTGFLRREVRRAIRVVAPEATLPPTIEPTAPEPGRPEREGAIRRAAERAVAGVPPLRPEAVERTRRPARAEGRLAQPFAETEPATAEARPAPWRRRTVVVQPRPGAAMRAATRIEAARPEPAARRIALAARPTSYLDKLVEPVVEPAPEQAPARRYGRPSVRAAARVERVARTDTRGEAVLVSGGTDYLAVARASEAEGPLSRSPIGRTRPMRGALVDTSAVVTPVGPAEGPAEAAPTARAAARLDTARRAETAPVRRGPTAGVAAAAPEAASARGPVAARAIIAPHTTKASRASVVRQIAETTRRSARAPVPMVVPEVGAPEEPAVTAPVGERRARARRRVRVAETHRAAADAPARDAILVRDARGQVRPSRRVASGAAAYASARLLAKATEEVRGEVGIERTRRQAVTALERTAAPRRRGLPKAMPHTVAGSDFRWLMPDAEGEVAPAAGPAAPVSVVAERRVTGAGAVSKRRLAEVLARVSAIVRAVDRADEPRVLLPATRRTLQGARVTAEPRARRLSTVGGEGIVLRVVVEEEPPTPVARAEQRATLRTRAPGEAAAPEAIPLRRAFAGAEGVDQRPVERVATRAERAPAARRGTARTARGADGRYVASRPRLGEDGTGLFGRGRPGLARGRHLPRVDVESGVVLPEPAEPAPRPLGSTLDYVGAAERPMRRGAVAMEPLAQPAEFEGEEAPAWAQRAVRGTAARRRRPAARPEAVDAASQTVRTPIRGDLFTALARASRPQDVVQVILERGRTLRSETRGLPEPAVRLVERIVRVQEQEEASSRRARPAPEGSLLGRRGARRRSGSFGVPTTSLPRGAGGVPAATVRRVTGLADRLMELIHLAEVERKVADAQRQVRMAADTPEARAEGGHGKSGAAGAGAAPNLKALESEVLAAVIRELDLMKIRRLEDFSDVWW